MTKHLKNIFYVDDEEDILEIASMCLETVGGFHVSVCSDSGIAHDRIQAEQPDLILLDAMMPIKDGPALLKEIKSNKNVSHIPVVFMTARIRPADIQRYLDIGAAGVIEKPFDPMAISDQIVNIWSKHNGGV